MDTLIYVTLEDSKIMYMRQLEQYMSSRVYSCYRQDSRLRLSADQLAAVDQSEVGKCRLIIPDGCLAPWRVVKSRNSSASLTFRPLSIFVSW
jgi:hypothetical protein